MEGLDVDAKVPALIKYVIKVLLVERRAEEGVAKHSWRQCLGLMVSL